MVSTPLLGSFERFLPFLLRNAHPLNSLTVFAGLSLEQAQVLAELFSGKTGMLANPAPCTIAELQNYYSRCAGLDLAACKDFIHCCCS